MSISYHKIGNLPFYSLNQFTQLQPLSRGHSPIYLYQHNQSKQIFVVKEVSYNQQTLKIYEKIIKLYGLDSIVRIRGICKMVIKYAKSQKKRKHQISQNSLYFQNNPTYFGKNQHQISQSQIQRKQNQEKCKQQQLLLLFMERCEQNMVDYIKTRKREGRPLKSQEVTNFINQTLFLLQTLEKENICHRDIKPQNFLYDKGKFKLCDFQNSLYLDPLLSIQQRNILDLTTVQYSSPQFFRNLRECKKKIFDPYKLDLYAFGVTIIYVCSMGKFDLSERRQYLQQNSIFHHNFMKQQRRRYLKNNDQFKGLNTIVKIMLQEDQYKRDTFITLLMKIKPIMNLRELEINILEQQTFSDNSKSQQSRKKLKNISKKSSKKTNWEGTTDIQRKCLKILLASTFSFFILVLII